MPKATMKAKDIIEYLRKEDKAQTMEGQLLRPKLIRELYRQLGAPKEEDFKSEFKHAHYWSKFPGYTTNMEVATPSRMERYNNSPTDWCIKYPSEIKRSIVKDYEADGWHCTVQAFNVLCGKYVKHPRHKNLWVYFYSTRDVSRYEYIIEAEDE